MTKFGTTPFVGANGSAARSLGKPAGRFPSSIATDADLAIAVDRQQTRLAAPLDASATSMTVENAASIVAANLLSIDSEIVRTTGAPVGNTVPIQRGFDGTTPAIHLASALVSGFIDAWHHNALVAEVQAIEATLGTNLSNVPDAPVLPAGLLTSEALDFPAQTPGGALTPGTNSITLAPVPLGVNGTNTSHFLLIEGGTGALEAVAITGGAAVAGAASGQIFVTCANAHSGAWTIRSATAGIQEALYHSISFGSGTDSGRTVIFTRTAFVYARITFPLRPWFPAFSLVGGGEAAPGIVRHTSYPNGDLFRFESIGSNQGSLYIGRLLIYNGGPFGSPVNTGGAAIHVKNNLSGQIVLEDIDIQGGWRGVEIESCDAVTVRNLYIINTGDFLSVLPSHSGIYIHDATGFKNPSTIHITGTTIHGHSLATNATEYGILIEASDGIKIESVNIGQIQNGIGINAVSAVGIGVVIISDSVMDSFRTHSIVIGGSSSQISNVTISHSWIANRSDIFPAIPSRECIAHSAIATTVNLAVRDCIIGPSKLAGMKFLGSITGLNVTGNIIYASNMDNVASEPAVYIGDGVRKYIFLGNQSYNLAGSGGHPKYGLTIAAGALEGVVTGNQLIGHETAALNFTGPQPTLILRDNLGIDEVVPLVPSNATLLVPPSPVFKITGTSGITAVQSVGGLLNGARGGLITVDGAVTFTAGATIGNTFTTVQNRLHTWFYDGTKIYLG